MDDNEKIDFEKLLQESKELCNMIASHDILGQKINEILKALTHVIYVQNGKINQLDQIAIDYKNQYEDMQVKYTNLKSEYNELEKDYNIVFNANERRKKLLQSIHDNEDNEE